jgi:MYXO-CTERM domain-containing protein
MEFAIQPDIRLDMDFTPDVMSDLGWSVVEGLTVGVVKLLEPLVVAGNQSSYVMAIINRRPTAINSVTLALTPPSSSTVVSTVSSPAGCSGFPCTFGPMQPGDVVIVVTTLQVAATASGPFPVSVTLTPSSPSAADSLTATTSQTVATGGDVKVSVTGPSAVIPGSTATLVTTVTNAGPGTATGVVLNGAVSSSPNPPTFSANSGVCTGTFPCSLGTMASGTSFQVNSVFNVPAGFASGATFAATVSSTTQDPSPGNNSASYAFSVTGKSGCSTSGEPATVLGLLGLAFGLALHRRRGRP